MTFVAVDVYKRQVEYWCRELKENPNLMDALESDVNNAIEVINKAERGEKIEYATMRNRRDTSTMQEPVSYTHLKIANRKESRGKTNHLAFYGDVYKRQVARHRDDSL